VGRNPLIIFGADLLTVHVQLNTARAATGT
jgi:hypothetical protein